MYNPQLDTFLAVVEAGSFNKAAERLYISPPAVIKQINLLESSLGVRLFTRTHRGLVLTEAGRSLAQAPGMSCSIAKTPSPVPEMPLAGNRKCFALAHPP